MMRASGIAVASVIFVSVPTPALADDIDFVVEAGRLDAALVNFARQAGLSVNVQDPRLRRVSVRGLRGRYEPRVGLARLLRGTGYEFEIVGSSVIRLIASRPNGRAERTPANPARVSPPGPAPAVDAPRPVAIIVSATKQDVALADFPGSISVIDLSEEDAMRWGAKGSELLLRALPNLASTDLGSGRNKIFIRGIADSSFNGNTQSTISQYFGESRLIYSAPDPDLGMYDIERVEVLEGSQGTLYGAGSLGGVIRLTPRAPELSEAALLVSGALTAARGYGLGGDAALVANLPLKRDVAALRVVAYQTLAPGYINDTLRKREDINRTDVTGLRATVRWQPRNDWIVDAGVIAQDTASRDGQYTEIDQPGLSRRSAISQPYDNDFRLGFITVVKDLGSVRLISTSGYVHHSIGSDFDATPPGAEAAPLLFEDEMIARLIAHETRISGSGGWLSSWVAGVSVVDNYNRIQRTFGAADAPTLIADYRNKTFDAALFGEASRDLAQSLTATLGGRVAYVRQVSEVSVPASLSGLEPARNDWRLLPTAALAWKPWRSGLLYVRYGEGFRPGAQQIVSDSGTAEVRRFEPDEIGTWEFGARFGTGRGARLSGGLSVARSRWSDVQADLVSQTGFPYVANLGSGYIRQVSAQFAWMPIDALEIEASGFLSSSNLDKPASAFAISMERDLPNIADEGWRLAARWHGDLTFARLTLDGVVNRVGSSTLAIGAPFNIAQGGYYDAALGGRMEFGAWGIALDIDNLFDSRANRFSYGNPFTVAQGRQQTPLRPRTFRIGVDAQF